MSLNSVKNQLQIYCDSFQIYFQQIQIFRVVELGEEERSEPQYQVFCFITPFQSNEFITSDAMSKLRQVIIMLPWASAGEGRAKGAKFSYSAFGTKCCFSATNHAPSKK